MRIGIVGSGISGLSAAWMLDEAGHDVIVYEKDDYIGGHSNTVDVARPTRSNPEAKQPVDTGFIVYNEVRLRLHGLPARQQPASASGPRHNYPHLTNLFRTLRVRTEASDMSFAVSVLGRGGIEWAGDSLSTVFAQRRNLLRPSFWSMFMEMMRFNWEAPRLLALDCPASKSRLTLGQYLDQNGYSQHFRRLYLLPMTAAIWSAPMETIISFPVATIVRFMNNHGMLQIFERPAWRTVTGGSREYVKLITAKFAHKVRLSTAVAGVERRADCVIVRDERGQSERFDQIILAAHGDQALQILGSDATAGERSVLGCFRYQDNEAVLHTDPALMPRDDTIWASWNYQTAPTADARDCNVSVTYWMNRLQNIDKSFPLFVSLNPVVTPAPDLVIARFKYEHPLFSMEAMDAQRRLSTIQGKNRTWFCGAWVGYGFHEDGFAAAFDVVEGLGVRTPWDLPELHRKTRRWRVEGRAEEHTPGSRAAFSRVVDCSVRVALSLACRALRFLSFFEGLPPFSLLLGTGK
eukprot:tig00021433_g21271.t1